ncbi:legumin B-like [Dorcoceras hygrometricum]|uniref:Legumin B-like n=1 Tax=Dorcoceras hygrometricum TaxID=472368 RepID=A0A2Z7BYI2_9LAMI|nr:legumin B-like [Dorcoceras hygrometricum]
MAPAAGKTSARSTNSLRVQSEGGYNELWDFNKDEFQCDGVSFHRHTVQARGMMLPAYHNSPLLVYVVQGSFISKSIPTTNFSWQRTLKVHKRSTSGTERSMEEANAANMKSAT